MARPTGVTILAVLSFIGALLSILGGLGMFLMGAVGASAMAAGRGGIGGPLAMMGAMGGVILLLLAVLYAVNGVGLLKLKGWARMLTLILLVIGICFELLTIFRSFVPLHMGIIIWELILIAIDVWIITYLFKPHVKQAFGTA